MILRRLYYALLLSRDVVGYCIANRVAWPFFLIAMLALLAALVGVAEFAAPYIYTLF